MGHIFYVMGKSASGKDTIYKILRERLPQIRTVVPYTTRPIRAGERDGVEYYFVTGKRLADLEKQGKIIEKRTYQTVYGPWSYATVDDGQIDLGSHDYFMIGTLESYEGTRNYFGADVLVPLYIEVEDGERLQRALDRERQQTEPKYAELCRRFLADEADFSAENMEKCGIRAENRFENRELEACGYVGKGNSGSGIGTFGTESAVRKRGGSRNLPYLNAKPRQIPLLGTYA